MPRDSLTGPLGRLEAEKASHSPALDDLFLGEQRVRDRVGGLKDVVEGGDTGPEHFGTHIIGGSRDHFDVESVFDLGPPVVLEEAPEVRGSIVDGNAVGEGAVEMNVGIDETREKN